MAEEYILIRDIIQDHNERMLNIKKYYPYFKLSENAFSQFQGGKYEELDMGYILMAVLRFFIEENNFKEKDVTYEEYKKFVREIIRRDFMMPLDENEEEEVASYIFDKIKNDGKPFTYQYFDPAEKKKKLIRIKIIDSRIKNDTIGYFITSDAIEFYLDTKEIKDESTISISQVLLGKMISAKNFKGGIEVIRRINNEVGRLKARKNEVLNILNYDVFNGIKVYEEFLNSGIKWFDEEQKLFRKNMELIKTALSKVENDENYYNAVDDIYYLETELKKTINRHRELLAACTDLQIKADEIIEKAKYSRIKKDFDFKNALNLIMERDDMSLLEVLVKPLIGIHINKGFSLKSIDKMLTLKSDRKEENEIIKGETPQENYVYEDEVEEERIYHNYSNIIRELVVCIFDLEKFDLVRFNTRLRNKYGDEIFKNGDYYSMLVHMCQKDEYIFDDIVNKAETFFEEYLRAVLKDMDREVYGGMKVRLFFDSNDKIDFFNSFEISNVTFKLDYVENER